MSRLTRTARILRSIANTDGKSCLVSGYPSLIAGTSDDKNLRAGGDSDGRSRESRKVALARSGDEIEVWGDGEQTRSLLISRSASKGRCGSCAPIFSGPVNIGSDELVTINQFVDLVADIAGKQIQKNHIPGPQGGAWTQF